eukprot:scaffold7375_cov268-Pinguiococcus_pyrenoidosus.AAC.8
MACTRSREMASSTRLRKPCEFAHSASSATRPLPCMLVRTAACTALYRAASSWPYDMSNTGTRSPFRASRSLSSKLSTRDIQIEVGREKLDAKITLQLDHQLNHLHTDELGLLNLKRSVEVGGRATQWAAVFRIRGEPVLDAILAENMVARGHVRVHELSQTNAALDVLVAACFALAVDDTAYELINLPERERLGGCIPTGDQKLEHASPKELAGLAKGLGLLKVVSAEALVAHEDVENHLVQLPGLRRPFVLSPILIGREDGRQAELQEDLLQEPLRSKLDLGVQRMT